MGQTGLKVLMVTAPGKVGGLESVVLALAAGLRERGHHVVVSAAVGQSVTGHPFLEGLERHGVELFRPRGGYLSEASDLRRLIRSGTVDVVHSHGYRSDALALAASRGLQVPVVSTVHGFTGGNLKNRVYERLQRTLLRRFRAIIAVSRPLRDGLIRDGVPAERIHLLPNAYYAAHPMLNRTSAREELGIVSEATAVGWVGRLSAEKGPDVAVDAMARLNEAGWLGIFIGDGPERASVQSQCERVGVTERVRWVGLVPEAGRLTRAFDVMLISSRTEGTPVVALDAMAAGVPLVATAVGGVPDLLEGDCGWLVPPGDSGAMAEALRSVRSDPAEAGRRAARALQRIEQQRNRADWLTAHEKLYSSVTET